ncbi:MAG TPA: hypothetical protein VFP34_15840 [Microlunatus sp.]|nr:hypothetical protein [Microlunatus sp.]
MNELANLYESFRRIPVYVAVMMVFVIIQFIVVSILGVYIAVQMRKIADAVEASNQRQLPTSGPSPYLHPFGGQPPRYGPTGPRQP